MIQSLTPTVQTRRANRQRVGLMAFVSGAAAMAGLVHSVVAGPPLWQVVSDWLCGRDWSRS